MRSMVGWAFYGKDMASLLVAIEVVQTENNMGEGQC